MPSLVAEEGKLRGQVAKICTEVASSKARSESLEKVQRETVAIWCNIAELLSAITQAHWQQKELEGSLHSNEA